jgi:hypothetical protein
MLLFKQQKIICIQMNYWIMRERERERERESLQFLVGLTMVKEKTQNIYINLLIGS